jgi:Ca2+-transporting ATPase
VLLEDDFDQMAEAIEQGRAIYANIRRSLRYLVASNLSEVITVAVALLFRMPIPFSALQMLWMNLISDVFPALALTIEQPPADAMRQPPRAPDEPLIASPEWRVMSRDAVTLGASTLAAYRSAIRRHGAGPAAQTVAFTTAALGEIFYVLACGSPLVRSSDQHFPRPNLLLLGTAGGTAALQVALFLFPLTRRLLGITSLDRADWMTVLLGSALPAALAAQRHRPEDTLTPLGLRQIAPPPAASTPAGPGHGFRVA